MRLKAAWRSVLAVHTLCAERRSEAVASVPGHAVLVFKVACDAGTGCDHAKRASDAGSQQQSNDREGEAIVVHGGVVSL